MPSRGRVGDTRITRQILTIAVTFTVLLASGCGSALSRRQLELANGAAEAVSSGVGTGQGPDTADGGSGGAGTTNGAPEPASGAQAVGAADKSGGGQANGGSAAGTRQSGSAAATSEIVLGAIGTASGPIGAAIAPHLTGTRAWVASINARGGLNGHHVRLIVGDDGGDPGRALTLAKTMAEQNHVLAFFNTFAPSTIQAIVPYAEKNNIPIIGSIGGQYIEDESPVVFNAHGAKALTDGGNAMNIGKQMPGAKVALIYCRETQACTQLSEKFKKYVSQANITVVYEAQVSIAQPDYTAEALGAKNAGAQVVFLGVDNASGLRFVRSAARQGYRPTLAGSTSHNAEDWRGFGSEVDGTIAFAPTAPYSSPKMADYRGAVRRFVPGGAVGELGAMAWTQGKLLERVAGSFGETLSRDQLLAGLYGLRGETLGGIVHPFTFNQGPHANVNPCFVPVKLSAGQWTEPFGEDFVCFELQ